MKKNVIEGGAKADKISIGDNITNYNDYSKKTEATKELTARIPKTPPDKIIGRENELEDLKRRLFDNKQVVLVNGLGGIGKTTLAQVYTAKYWDEYAHVAWISQISENIVSDFVETEGLLQSLNIEGGGKEPKNIFFEILNNLKGLEEGPNLLIIDNADTALSEWHDYLPNQPHWHILITSREQIRHFDLKDLGFLSKDEAVSLFHHYYSREKINEEEIKELVTGVDLHTLTIEILAKTAQNQRLEFSRLKKAMGDDIRANVDVNHKGGKIEKLLLICAQFFQ